MNLHLRGLRAVVTGGSSGIGLAIVRVLAEEGCAVAFCGRSATRIDAALHTLTGLPGAVTACALDVNDAVAFKAWLATLGGFDIFVLNVSALSADQGLSSSESPPREHLRSPRARRRVQPRRRPGQDVQRRARASEGLTRRAGVAKGAGCRCGPCPGVQPGLRPAPKPVPLAAPARGRFIG